MNQFVNLDNTTEFKSTPIDGVELVIGSGNDNDKQMSLKGKKEWSDRVTLDIDPDSNPDVLWDLNHIPLPFEDEVFEEIHAYDVLEHIGTQGDWRGFFALFSELHRILKPEGHILATVPCWDSLWAWGDPGHTRIINEGTLVFLDQQTYKKEVGTSPLTDYRHVYKADFSVEHTEESGERFCFVLKKK